MNSLLRKPEWLRVRLPDGSPEHIRRLLHGLGLNTICEQAGCPNCCECFGRGTAAFLILGRVCSRNCRFCQVLSGEPEALDPAEPARLAEAVCAMKLLHVVITSVTRDDLPDGGSGHFAAVIRAIRSACRENCPAIEVLIPDFQGDAAALKTIVDASPDILNHNIETVPRLYQTVRPQAAYERSLALLARAKSLNPHLLTKSGLMVGLGERPDEVLAALRDLRSRQCDLVTIGQYLAPSRQHLPVVEYVHPDMFAEYRRQAEVMGFLAVASGPLVRSSYRAEQMMRHESSLVKI
jgi:lipoyl synthase